MPTAFEREAARRAALEANANRFMGRSEPVAPPPPPPIPPPTPRMSMAELDTAWLTNAFHRFGNSVRGNTPATVQFTRDVLREGVTNIQDSWIANAIPPIVSTLEDRVQIIPPPPRPETKTVTFDGMELEVPWWAHHITQNKDGKIIAWETQPFYREDTGYYAIGTFPLSKLIMKPEEYPEMIEQV